MNLKLQLQRDEDTVLHVYADSRGFLTLGTGRLVDPRKGGGISQAEADFLLDNDIASKSLELSQKAPWTAKLDDARRGALLNMAFNLGVDGLLAFHQFMGFVQNGQYDQAADDLETTLWFTQVGGRAKRLQQQIRTGEWV